MRTRWTWGVSGLALLFVAWCVWLIVTVNSYQAAIGVRVGQISRLARVETTVRSFGTAFAESQLDHAPEQVCPMEARSTAYRAAVAALHQKGPLPDNVLGHVDRVDKIVESFGPALSRLDNPALTARESALATTDFYRLVDSAANEIQSAIQMLRGELSGISTALWTKWRHLHVLAITSCGLVCVLCVLLKFHQREHMARRRAEQILADNEQKFRTLAMHSPVGIFLTDANGDGLYVNPRYEELTGRSANESMGKGWIKAIHPEDRERVMSEWYDATASGREYISECRFLTPDGRVNWISASACALRSDDGRITGYVGTTKNINDRRRLEDESRRHQKRLEETSRLRVMAEMAAGLAHELKQPLCAVSIYAQACLHSLGPQSQSPVDLHATIRKIDEQARRAGEVIDRIRSFVSKGELQLAEVNMNDIVRTVVSDVTSGFDYPRVPIQMELQGDLPPANIDALQVEHVLRNLVTNGVESMREAGAHGPLIIKTAATSDSSIVVAVRDCGVGLTPVVAERVFEPFFTTKRDGMGMGLSISKSIIEAHEGRLTASSNTDGGATFQFAIPLPNRSDETDDNGADSICRG